MTKFQQWARDNYKTGDPIDEMLHPEIQAECRVMNDEEEERKRKASERIASVVSGVRDMEEVYRGFIIVQASFRGSLSKTKKMTRPEIESLLDGLPAERRAKAKEDLSRGEKRLFSQKGFPELETLESQRNKWRQQIRGFGIPFFGNGQTIMRVTLIPKVDELVEKIEKDQKELVAALVAAYPEAIKKEKVDSEFYDANDYRAVESLGGLFSFRVGWMGFAPEDMLLGQVSEARAKANLEKTRELWEEVRENGRLVIRKEIAALTERLVESVTDRQGGEKKRFYSSAITNLEEFFSTFGDRNLADDKELESEVQKLRDLISGKGLDQFKSDEALRSQVRKSGAEIKQKLQGMIVSASSRAISFED